MLISSILFAVLHLTNIAGMDALSVAIQFGYSLVIGMVLAAVYLKNYSILQVIALHFLIDFYAPYLCGTGCVSHYYAYRPVCDPAGRGSGLRR